jgi:predicted house-cleaning noncanonical NTP pyrophosphatase (MazG superfamily)
LPRPRTEHLTDAKLTVSLKELPEDLHARLKEAAELSDAALIDQVIKEISSKDEALVDDLLKLAENFAYDKILGLIQGSGRTIVTKSFKSEEVPARVKTHLALRHLKLQMDKKMPNCRKRSMQSRSSRDLSHLRIMQKNSKRYRLLGTNRIIFEQPY